MRCGSSGGCYNGDLSGYLRLLHAQVTVADGTPPSVYAGGDAAGAGWKGGTRQLVIEANDNVGIKYVRALVDGVQVADRPRSCDYRQKVPCPNGADALSVPLGGVSEGPHALTVQAVDSAGNSGRHRTATIQVDNTAPVSPVGATVEGGAGWRAQNAWTVHWTNPPQQFAPIAGARYSAVPARGRQPEPGRRREGEEGMRHRRSQTSMTSPRSRTSSCPELVSGTCGCGSSTPRATPTQTTAATISGLGL